MKYKVEHINKVNQDTLRFLTNSKEAKNWNDYDTLAIIEGILNAVFYMVFYVAPSKEIATATIKAILKRFIK